MARNPLFTDGLYFFSNLYDDSLLSEFYPKITKESWSESMNIQKSLATRGLRSSGDFNYFKGSIFDLAVNASFNEKYGFNPGTMSMRLDGFVLPVKDQRLLTRIYLSNNRQFMRIPQIDLIDKPNIFSRSVTIEFGDNYIMTATFVVDLNGIVYLVLPYKANSSVSDDTTWNSLDYANIDSYRTAHADERDDESENVFKPYSTLWVYSSDEQDTVIRLGTSGSKSPLSNYSIMTISGVDRFIFQMDTRDTTTSFIGTKRGYYNGEDSGNWTLLIMNGFQGNMFYALPARAYSVAHSSDGNMSGRFMLTETDFFRTIRSSGRYAGYYCYLIKNPDLRTIYTINDTTIEGSQKYELVQSRRSPTINNVPSIYNVAAYAYDPANEHRLYRLDSFGLEKLCFPAYYDFEPVNPEYKPLRIEVTEYINTRTNQTFHNPMKLADSLESLYGPNEASFSARMYDGIDVAQAGDTSPTEDFDPHGYIATAEDFMESDYWTTKDFRGYYLDRILETIKSDPSLVSDYFSFITAKDPMVHTISGTPKKFGFNTRDSTLTGDFTGSNPVVFNTSQYMEHWSEGVIAFTQPHSFIEVASNGEKVHAEFFVNGIHMIPTAHTFKNGVNYFFFPCAQIAAQMININVAGGKTRLLAQNPILIDIYPHSYASYEETPSMTTTIPAPGGEIKLFEDQVGKHHIHYIRPIDLAVIFGNELIPNVLDFFDIQLEVNEFTVSTPSGDRSFYLRKDQELNTIVPVIEGLFPGCSINPSGTARISLSETITSMIVNGFINENDRYYLMCKSLPIEDVYLVPLYSAYTGLSCTIRLENHYSIFNFSAGHASIVNDIALYLTINNPTDMVSIPKPGEYRSNAQRWVLYRNGILEPEFFIDSIGSAQSFAIRLYAFTNTIIQPSDQFTLIHLPEPMSIDMGEYSKNLSYLRYGTGMVTRPAELRTIFDLWPNSGVSPKSTGIMITEQQIEDNLPSLGTDGTAIFTDSVSKNRLGIPTKDSEADRTVYYSPNEIPAGVNLQTHERPYIARTLNGLPIISGKKIQASSPFNFYTRGEKNELCEVFLTMQDPSDVHTIKYTDSGFIAIGSFTGGNVIHRSPVGTLVAGRSYLMNLPYQGSLKWTIFGHLDGRFIAISENPMNNPAFSQYSSAQAIVASSYDGVNWFGDFTIGNFHYQSNLPTLPAGNDWDSFAYTSGQYLVGSSTAARTAFSRYSSFTFNWNDVSSSIVSPTCIVADGIDHFIAIDGNRGLATMGMSPGATQFVWSTTNPIVGSAPWNFALWTGGWFHVYEKNFSYVAISPDAIRWGTRPVNLQIEHLDVIHVNSHGFDLIIGTEGARTPKLRYGKVKSSGGGWYLQMEPNHLIDRYIAGEDGDLNIKDQLTYEFSLLDGFLGGGSNNIIKIQFAKNYRRDT